MSTLVMAIRTNKEDPKVLVTDLRLKAFAIDSAAITAFSGWTSEQYLKVSDDVAQDAAKLMDEILSLETTEKV